MRRRIHAGIHIFMLHSILLVSTQPRRVDFNKFSAFWIGALDSKRQHIQPIEFHAIHHEQGNDGRRPDPDRLARNSIDGGRIIYLLDTGKLTTLKFPTFRFESDPQGKFMLNIMFGQSKYYVDSLSENTKRGLREKVRRGEFPHQAPIGYLNDYRTKKIIVDRERAPLVKEAFEMYATGDSGTDSGFRVP